MCLQISTTCPPSPTHDPSPSSAPPFFYFASPSPSCPLCLLAFHLPICLSCLAASVARASTRESGLKAVMKFMLHSPDLEPVLGMQETVLSALLGVVRGKGTESQVK